MLHAQRERVDVTNVCGFDNLPHFDQVLESGLDRIGVPYAYGFAIILLTVLVKAATFPLTQKQVLDHPWIFEVLPVSSGPQSGNEDWRTTNPS